MLSRCARTSGFSMIAVTGALIIIGLLMVGALHLVLDHNRRAALSADRALAMHEAEAALAAAECEIAIATDTPGREGCQAELDAARIAALDPVTLAGFARHQCGKNSASRGLCWPQDGESVETLSELTLNERNAISLLPTDSPWRQPAHRARYVIEPIRDALSGQWVHANASRIPVLFRITAVGFGADEAVYVKLQTVYRPRGTEP